MFDIVVAIVFGVLGYLFHKFQWPIIPFVLCTVLGPKIESSFIQSMEMSSGNLLIFVQRPISLTILIIAVIFLILSVLLMKRTKRRILQETGEEMEFS